MFTLDLTETDNYLPMEYVFLNLEYEKKRQ